MQGLYLQKMIYKIGMIFLVIGALNWGLIGLGGAKWNLVERIFGSKSKISSVIYGLVGLAATFVVFSRDFYLPFLGEMVAPCSVLSDKIPDGASQEVRISVAPGSKVLYWAAEPANENLKTLNTWKDAYLEYKNAGVVTAGSDGIAILKVRPPQVYSVPFKGKLESHVHFRICGENGMMSRINTVFLSNK